MTPKKICIVSSALKMGGVERASINLANTACSLGIKIIFIVLFKQEHFFKLNKEIIFYEPQDFNINKLNIPKTIFWLHEILKKEKVNVILGFTLFYSAITAISLFNINAKLFLSERSSPIFKWPLKIRLLSKVAFMIKPPVGIISQTRLAAEIQRKKYRKNIAIKVIPNPVREIKLYPDIKRENFILAVGRLGDHLKGFDRLIEAFALVKSQVWKLVIAGGDEDGEYLKERARKLNIYGRVDFLGKVKEIDKWYAKAGIFVIPSRSEGFPNALVEAMAAGIPCISFNFIAGPQDIIENGVNGILVEDGNIPELAQSIDDLIIDEEKRKKIAEKAVLSKIIYERQKIVIEYIKFITG